MKFPANTTLVMIGDSITDSGRARPVGAGEGLGHGYVRFVDALLGASYPERRVRVLNTGVGGDTVRDLARRWRGDVLDLRPTWLSVMIGTNDVWRQFDSPRAPAAAVQPVEFEATYRDLVAATRPHVEGVVLMTPFYVEPRRDEPMRARMDEYGGIVRRIAAENRCDLVDVQAALDRACESVPPAALAPDRVHPSDLGAMVIARAFLKAVEFEF